MSLLPFAGGTLNVSGTGDATDVNAYVCNMVNGFHGEYTNFSFNSLANIGGIVYGCTTTRVFSLVGDDDNGTAIGAAILSGIIDTGEETSAQLKNIDMAHLNARLYEPNVYVRTRIDESTDRLYPARPTQVNQGMSAQRVIMSKGLKGVNWQIGLENMDGGDFQAQDINPKLNVLKRRY